MKNWKLTACKFFQKILYIYFLTCLIGFVDATNDSRASSFRSKDFCRNNCQKLPWIEPYPKCVAGKCTCDDNQCKILTLSSSNSNGNVRYYCGECGVIGSVCGHKGGNVTCQNPGFCDHNGFCSCPSGETPVFELCVQYYVITSSRLTIILAVSLLCMLIALRLFTLHKFLRRCFLSLANRCHCCRRCARRISPPEESVSGHNPESGTKSAAYTITGRDFITTSTDPDLDWALELSLQLASGLSSDNGASTSSGTVGLLRGSNSSRKPRMRRHFSTRSSTHSTISSDDYSLDDDGQSSTYSSANSSLASSLRRNH